MNERDPNESELCCELFSICNRYPKFSPIEFKKLLQKSPNVLHIKDEKGRLPLHLALKMHFPFISIYFLIKHWPESVQEKTIYGKVPLHYVRFDNEQSLRYVQMLVQAWPDAVREQDDRGRLPLHYACFNASGQPEGIIQLLVECWPESLLVSTIAGNLPLHVACSYHSPSVTRYLINASPQSVQFQNKDLHLPLHYALETRQTDEVIQMLVECWPKSLLVSTNAGNLPLHLACSYHSPAVIRHLVSSAPQAVHVKNKCLRLPLHNALERDPALPLEVIEDLVCAWPQSCVVACSIYVYAEDDYYYDDDYDEYDDTHHCY